MRPFEIEPETKIPTTHKAKRKTKPKLRMQNQTKETNEKKTISMPNRSFYSWKELRLLCTLRVVVSTLSLIRCGARGVLCTFFSFPQTYFTNASSLHIFFVLSHHRPLLLSTPRAGELTTGEASGRLCGRYVH